MVSFRIRGGMSHGIEFLFEVHGDRGDLTLTDTGASMQRQDLIVRAAKDSPNFRCRPSIARCRTARRAIPATTWPSSTRGRPKASATQAGEPQFGRAATRHRLLDAIAWLGNRSEASAERNSKLS